MFKEAHAKTTVGDKLAFYGAWANSYDQDIAVIDYSGPSLAAKSLSAHFSGDREAAVVLDVACGTGLVAEQMKTYGFRNFVGIDGSKGMLEEAQRKELYQDLKQCILGKQLLPVQRRSFDVVVICAALSVHLAPFTVVRELCNACKPGGYVVMTCFHSPENLEYNTALECELKHMEKEGLRSCVECNVTEIQKRRAGSVYLYKTV
ncbi:methyltransferase-like protein 27 [Pagrus major]|uniref:methyltransferase-like protein 27 n=1 Tax=Pagrus major TaxID=143350 RepID=UPI003CC87166